MRAHRTAAATALLLLAGAAAAQETVANPEFADWAKFNAILWNHFNPGVPEPAPVRSLVLVR